MTDNPVIHMPDRNQSPALPRGRLVFAVDATASREPTWNIAKELQAKMFRDAAPIGKLDLQLVYYRGGYTPGGLDRPLEERGGRECRASGWCQSGEQLARSMSKINCKSGYTQIGRVLDHVLSEHKKAPVQAVTFIGDAMEEEIDVLAAKAAKLGAAGVPIFIFQEGRNPDVRKAFRLLALKSGGAYFEFNPDKPRAVEQLSEQLNAVARLAVGDADALLRLEDQRG